MYFIPSWVLPSHVLSYTEPPRLFSLSYCTQQYLRPSVPVRILIFMQNNILTDVFYTFLGSPISCTILYRAPKIVCPLVLYPAIFATIRTCAYIDFYAKQYSY